MKTRIIILLSPLTLMLGCVKTPKADFNVSSSSPIETEMVSFTNTSDDYKTYTWSFGDYTSSTDKNPTHTYLRAGSFNVKLSVYSKKEKKTDVKEMTVNVQPSALRKKIEGTWILDSLRDDIYNIVTNTLINSYVEHGYYRWKFENPYILDEDGGAFFTWRVKSDHEIIFNPGDVGESSLDWIIPVTFLNATTLKLIWSRTDENIRTDRYLYYTKG